MSNVPTLADIMAAVHDAQETARAVFKTAVEQADARLATVKKEVAAVAVDHSKAADAAFKRALAEAVQQAHDARHAVAATNRAAREEKLGQAQSERDAAVAQAQEALDAALTRVTSLWSSYQEATQNAVAADAAAASISTRMIAELKN